MSGSSEPVNRLFDFTIRARSDSSLYYSASRRAEVVTEIALLDHCLVLPSGPMVRGWGGDRGATARGPCERFAIAHGVARDGAQGGLL